MIKVFLALAIGLTMSGAAAAQEAVRAHRLVDADGVGIAWFEGGADHATQPPILFVHGGPAEGSQVFRATVMAALAEKTRVAAFDLRGAGISSAPDEARFYSPQGVMTDIAAVQEALGGRPVVLVGHSAGSIWALDYAQAHPERVAGLVLTGAVPDIPFALDRLCDRLAAKDAEAMARAVAAASPGQRCMPFAAFPDQAASQAWFDDNMFPFERGRRLVTQLDFADHVRHTMVGGAIPAHIMTYKVERPERLTMPLLFIDGAHDHQTADEPQRALVARVPRGRFVQYEDAGHFPFVDRPERFVADVLAFVASLPRG